jgi:hypothetical protein
MASRTANLLELFESHPDLDAFFRTAGCAPSPSVKMPDATTRPGTEARGWRGWHLSAGSDSSAGVLEK